MVSGTGRDGPLRKLTDVFISFGIANMYVASEGTTGGVWVCDAGGCYAGPFGR